MAHDDSSWRGTYLLGVALLLPIGTVVLVSYYFTRMNPFAHEPSHDPFAYSIIAVAGGLSGVMATVLALFASATYRARVRFESEYRNLQRFLNDDVAKERTRLMRNLDLVSAAQQVSLAIKQEVEFERILSVVLEQLEHFARSDSISVFTLDETSRPVARAERRAGIDRFPPVLTQEGVERSLVEDAIKHARQVRHLDERTGQFVLAVYFSTPEGVRGVVRIARNVADEPDFSDEMPAYEQAVGQLVRMVSLGLKTASIWDRAIKDEKTGLYNNNHYQDQMRKQVALAQRTGGALSLIMLDIDKFKHINDTYGHLAGDAVLARVAEILRREARESDTVYRYGGEELCIVATGTSRDEAAHAAERLRHIIACTEFVDERGRLLPISSSFGVAGFDRHSMQSEMALKEMCDRALYVAKNHGRNCVVAALGGERFDVLERSGDPDREVKRRLGLAGDNSPLDGNRDPEPLPESAASARAQLGESVDALATSLAEVVGSDTSRARVVDHVVREAAEFLTRNLSARLGSDKPKRRRKVERRKEAIESDQHEAAPAASDKPKRRRAPRRKKGAPPIPPPLTPEEAAAKAESDRLDYLTPDEGDQLAKGKAPSKRLRKTRAQKVS
ncbi:MAG: GGDEF domain-containing protein [Planctomycetes bacterium]|nr:GGDEF domain-containing protein [Planctomycetota bacterium]MCW8135728.1 GGDEF domain-containing protein [Planctomycetota bacterium]